MSKIAAVQFGLAIKRADDVRESPLTSGTIRGTSRSMRNALELSITTQSCFCAAGQYCLERSAPALKNARSTPSNASSQTACTSNSAPRNVIVCPADLALASRMRRFTGKLRASNRRKNSCPTAPVAPRIATVRFRSISQYGTEPPRLLGEPMHPRSNL